MSDANTPEIDDAPLAPEEMLALIQAQKRSVEWQFAGFVPHILLSWGLSWLIGFFLLWLIDGLQPAFGLPLPVAVPIFAAMIAVSIAISAILGARAGRGRKGNTGDAFTGIVYGCAWMAGALCIQLFAHGLIVNGMDPDLANIYYPIAYVLFTGIMYLLSAAIWRAIPMLILGGWTILVGLAAPFFGYPNHYLFLSLAGGIGLLVLAAFSYLRMAKLRRALPQDQEARRG